MQLGSTPTGIMAQNTLRLAGAYQFPQGHSQSTFGNLEGQGVPKPAAVLGAKKTCTHR